MERQHAESCWRKNFSETDHLERKNQERTNCERVKEQRLVFIHLLIHLPAIKALAVWIYLPQLCGSWFNFDQSRHNGNTDFRSTLQNKIPNGSHCFHWADKISMTQLGAPWWSLSQCQARGTCHIQQSNIQSNLPTQTVELIGEERNFFHVARHWL